MAKNRVSQASWGLIESVDDGEIYVEQCIDGTPSKRWKYSDLSPAGRNILSSLFMAFDYGYEIRFQFPKEKDGKRVIVPEKKPVMKTDSSTSSLLDRKISTAVVYFGEGEDDGMPEVSDIQDEDMMDYLEQYILEKNL